MTKILKIITHPQPSLREKSKEIKEAELGKTAMRKLFHDMTATMKKKDGIGLAAPQIGKNIRLITIATRDEDLIMVNPEITEKSWSKEWGEEGCLSVPEYFGDVKRHKKVSCRYLNEKGEKKLKKCEGLLARVVQHEIDHLDGILFIDKAKNIKKINDGK